MVVPMRWNCLARGAWIAGLACVVDACGPPAPSCPDGTYGYYPICRSASPDAWLYPPLEPELVISPNAVRFGDVFIGAASAPVDLTIENTGDGQSASLSLSIDGADASAFVITAAECPGMRLAPGQTCNVSVQMASSEPRAYSASLIVEDGDVTTRASLGGRGVSPDAGALDGAVMDVSIDDVGWHDAGAEDASAEGGDDAFADLDAS